MKSDVKVSDKQQEFYNQLISKDENAENTPKVKKEKKPKKDK